MNGGIVIQEHACPRCANRRTVRVGSMLRLFCFNCRHSWAPTYQFTPVELARLATYRAAVQAGFFTDQL
jgi:hypothetical protein